MAISPLCFFFVIVHHDDDGISERVAVVVVVFFLVVAAIYNIYMTYRLANFFVCMRLNAWMDEWMDGERRKNPLMWWLWPRNKTLNKIATEHNVIFLGVFQIADSIYKLSWWWWWSFFMIKINSHWMLQATIIIIFSSATTTHINPI